METENRLDTPEMKAKAKAYVDDMLELVKAELLDAVNDVHDHEADGTVVPMTVTVAPFVERRWDSVKQLCGEVMKVVGASHYHELGDRYHSTIPCEMNENHMQACLKTCYSALKAVRDGHYKHDHS